MIQVLYRSPPSKMSTLCAVTECIINADSGVNIECVAALDGSIAVQTQLGAINILLRRVQKQESHRIETPIRLTTCAVPTNHGQGTFFFFEDMIASCTGGE